MNQSTQVPRYWFPAKRYGWGWSTPATWQGWAVYAVQFLAVFVLFIAASPVDHPALFCGGMAALVVLFTFVCWLKGEPPRWRWGK